MNNYRYILEPYKGVKTRYSCPNCNKKNEFTKYIDRQSNEYINYKVGKCNRVTKCGYHYKPKQYFQENDISYETSLNIKTSKTTSKLKPKTSFIDVEVFNNSFNTKDANYFLDFLASIWDYDIAYYLADKYNIGTSTSWKGATIFWQVDINGNIRSGKIMLYNPSNGKRANCINWIHRALKLDGFNLEQCYFGEHLLMEDKYKPVALVESEKTAVIASVYLPEFIWLACGSVNNLNHAKTKVLKGRNVVLFPDLKCYEQWNNKIPSLTKLASFRTSTLLKRKATSKEFSQGLDIADYLIKKI